jgi:CBS domain-containing protein
MMVKEIMNRKLITVKEDDTVRSICKLLSKHKISGVPVLGKTGKLVGFVSERDVIAAVCKPDFTSKTARKLMTKRVRTISEDAPLTHASKIFSEEKYRHLPVVKGKKLVGIITRKDVANQMMKHYY